VTTADWLAVIVPAVAVKLAELVPAATVTEAGTVNAAALLDSVTAIPPAPAGCEIVTVQVDVLPELRLVGLHDRRVTVVTATSEIDVVCELPL
jgi:hypothetical protein